MRNYSYEYNKYKSKYLSMKREVCLPCKYVYDLDNIRKYRVIFVCGKAGVGKSHVAKTISEKYNYDLISMDQVIQEEVIPVYKDEINNIWDGNSGKMFSIYRGLNAIEPLIKKGRLLFTKIIKKKISSNKKVLVEGSLWHHPTINKIFGKNFTMIFVVPKNLDRYIQRITERFQKDPYGYGRIGALYIEDKDKEALNDYYKNGIRGELITKLINDVATKEYNRIDEWIDRYSGYDFVIYIN